MKQSHPRRSSFSALTLLLLPALLTLLPCALTVTAEGAVGIREDFSSDPFEEPSPRWVCTTPEGSYKPFWTGGPSPQVQLGSTAEKLPEPPDNAIYFFSQDTIDLLPGADNDKPLTPPCDISADFQILGDSVGDVSVGILFNRREGENSAVEIHVGGDGSTAWTGTHSGDQPPKYGGTKLEPGVWYRLHAQIAPANGELEVNASLTRVDDGQPVRPDLSETIPAPNRAEGNGYGLRVGLSKGHYWSRAIVMDNIVATGK
jgi:hypothetical protein